MAVPAPRLAEPDAVEAMLAALREAGPEGLAAKELQETAGRSSSWFYPKANELADQGVLRRTKHGTWALESNRPAHSV